MPAINPLLELNTTAVNVPFEIHTMEWIELNRWQQNAVPHRHNYFVIIWVKQGSGTHLIDLHKYPLHDNTIYCITPGQVHLLKTNSQAEGYVISFTADFLGMGGEYYDLLFNTGLFYTFSSSPVIKCRHAAGTGRHRGKDVERVQQFLFITG
jgi:AraC family transcriptional regulator, transcriptional activator of pobA